MVMQSAGARRSGGTATATAFAWQRIFPLPSLPAPRDLIGILQRTWQEASDDNIDLIAAGVAFYGFLAMVPLLGAVVLSYGLIATPATVMTNVQSLTSVMPADAAKLIGEQLLNLVTASGGKKGLGLLLALAIAIYGAMKGAGALVVALNVASEEVERRSFLRLQAISLVITVAGLFVAVGALLAIAALGHLGTVLPTLPAPIVFLGTAVTYIAISAAGGAAAVLLYRFGPCSHHVTLRRLLPGAITAAILWLAITLAFGLYVARLGSYDATYGSLGTVVVLLTWLYLSAYILLLGGELNFELDCFHDLRSKAAPTPIAEIAPAPSRDPETRVASRAGVGSAPATSGPPSRPTIVKDLAVVRAGSRLAGLLGSPGVAMLPALLGTGGLLFLRRRGGAGTGIALLVAGGGLSWLRRDKSSS